MTRTVTAMFDRRDQAESAKQRLAEAGVTDVQITGGAPTSDQGAVTSAAAAPSGDPLTTSPEPVRDVTEGDYGERGHGELGGADHGGASGLWAKVKSFFSHDDQPAYEEGLRRGHAVLTAHVDDARTEEAIRILEATDAVDVDKRADEWRSAGWSGMPAHDPGVAGHVGDDRLTGHHGDDQLRGPSTDDTLRLDETPAHDPGVAGHVGDDRVTGHHGDDQLRGPSTDDTLRLDEKPAHDPGVAGHVGDDRLTGHHGDDQLRGLPTDDALRLGETPDSDRDYLTAPLMGRKREADRGSSRVRSYVDDSSGVRGEARSFSAEDAGLDPTSGTDPDQTDEARRRREQPGGAIDPAI